MRRLLYALICVVALNTAVGCALPMYHSDPKERARQLMFTSENMRAMLLEWERFWFLDQPDHMSPQRTHGGVI
ncbi:MAG: hypothetical protein ABGX07_08645 [Pirellulaceae bacterium]|jgi:hypothetical protein|nr:hypothetical protein [Planctomycetaceae bacterium]